MTTPAILSYNLRSRTPTPPRTPLLYIYLSSRQSNMVVADYNESRPPTGCIVDAHDYSSSSLSSFHGRGYNGMARKPCSRSGRVQGRR